MEPLEWRVQHGLRMVSIARAVDQVELIALILANPRKRSHVDTRFPAISTVDAVLAEVKDGDGGSGKAQGRVKEEPSDDEVGLIASAL